VPTLAQNPVLNPAASYNANMSSVKVAELNNNNAPEIIGLSNISNAVVVLKNTGNGSYAAPQYYAVSGDATGLDIGDFNGDGKLDVAVSFGAYNAASGKVAVLRGNGDGTLQMPTYFTVPIPANSIAVSDFNNDNRQDIAVIGNTNDNATNTVAILTNTSTNTATISFSLHSFPAPVYFGPGGFPPDLVWNVTAGDFNGDGRIDLAYFDECGPDCGPAVEDNLVILANTAGGWVAKNPTGGTGASSMTAYDLDGDGITDLIIPFRGCHTPCVGVDVLYMKSDFSVADSVPLDIGGDNEDGPTPYQVVAGDFNNDGKTDIAGYSGGGTIAPSFTEVGPGIMMWTALGTRTFNPLKYYNQPSPPAEFSAFYTAAGFVDQNGTRDLVVPKGTVAQVWKNSTSTAGDPCAYLSSGGVHVCTPTSVPAGTVHFLASGRTNVQPLKRMELWVDGVKRAQRFTDRFHVDLTLASGTHTAGFFEVGASGLHIENKIYITAH
jgi:hypothetical protein